MDRLDRSMDYDDPSLAEIYDQKENWTEDIELIREFLPSRVPLNILECFSGTGRILVPLAHDGHMLTGIDISEAMMARAHDRLALLDDRIRNRVKLFTGDVLTADWGSGYDVVLLGCNCLFELSSPESQEKCIRHAYEVLVPGGYLFVDSNDSSGHGASPEDVGTEWTGLEGTTVDGAHVKLSGNKPPLRRYWSVKEGFGEYVCLQVVDQIGTSYSLTVIRSQSFDDGQVETEFI